MVDDPMTQLRGALHRGDTAAIVASLRTVGMDRNLQFAGEALVAVAEAEAEAGVVADDLTADCLRALREREADGDQELADAIEHLTQHTADSELVELRIDLEQLASLLDSGRDSGGGRIDLTTGEVWPEFTFDDDPDNDGDDEDEDEDARWLTVWPEGSSAAYRDMECFLATRTDPNLVRQLSIALDGQGAFRRFKNVLTDWPDDRQAWFDFSAGRSRGRARAWLAGEGYRAMPVIVRQS